jgi:hypothetical protein
MLKKEETKKSLDKVNDKLKKDKKSKKKPKFAQGVDPIFIYDNDNI